MDRHVSKLAEVMPHNALLRDLIAFADELGGSCGQNHNTVLDDAGLMFSDELTHYDNTPLNVHPFATTGGDGVHYSLLAIEGTVSESSPVVMTVPMAFDHPNHVIGENLREFMNLGCFSGYFSIEGIAYDYCREEELRRLERHQEPDDAWPEKLRLLRLMRERFSLRPWPQVRSRLAELQARLAPSLVIDYEKNPWLRRSTVE